MVKLRNIRFFTISVLLLFAFFAFGEGSEVAIVRVDTPLTDTKNADNNHIKIGEIKNKNLPISFLYDVDFVSYFDNREYNVPQLSQTLFGYRISPEVGVGINGKDGSSHKLIFGLSYNQPINGVWGRAIFSPTAYYQLDYKGFKVSLGSIPYRLMIEELPGIFLDDSIAYVKPNIMGALMSYSSQHGFFEFLCDWRGIPSETVRESFQLIGNGRYNHKWFYAGGRIMLNHLASYSNRNVGVSEQGAVYPYLGVDLSKILPLDSFSFNVGYYGAFDKVRYLGLDKFSHGFESELFMRWRFIALKNSLHIGDNLMPFYSIEDTQLYRGNRYYSSKIYNRTDLTFYLYNNNFVNCYFSFNIHTTANKNVYADLQQQLVVRFNLGGFNQKNKLTSLFGK